MRDPKRLPEILDRLRAAWSVYPELRLGQLLLCAVDKDDLFAVEDAELMRRLEEFVSRGKP